MNKVHFGIIGCGNIGPYHAEGIRNSPGAELVAVSDSSEPKAKELGEKNKVDWYKDYKEMLKRKDIDAISIGIPSGLHMQVAIDALEAGKHVISEKPLEVTLEKIDKMIAASKISGKHLAGILQSRFYENAKRIKADVDSGRFGKLILGDMYNKWFRSVDYYKSAGWRATWELDGGGALMNQAVHGVDLLLYYMGEVASVNAYCETLARNIQVEDTAVAILKFKNGALGVLEAATSIYPGSSRKIEIRGTKGTAVLSDNNTLTAYEFEGGKDEAEEFNKTKDSGGVSNPTAISAQGHILQFTAFTNALLKGEVPPITASEARKSVELIIAVYRSAKEKREIKLPL